MKKKLEALFNEYFNYLMLKNKEHVNYSLVIGDPCLINGYYYIREVSTVDSNNVVHKNKETISKIISSYFLKERNFDFLLKLLLVKFKFDKIVKVTSEESHYFYESDDPENEECYYIGSFTEEIPYEIHGEKRSGYNRFDFFITSSGFIYEDNVDDYIMHDEYLNQNNSLNLITKINR